MTAQANLLLGMAGGALQGQVWRSMFAWVAEPRRRWREDARARVGLDGPHRPLEQTPAICSSLRAGHPECNLCREKTIKVWQCPSRAELVERPTGEGGEGVSGRTHHRSRRAHARTALATARARVRLATVSSILATLTISIPDRHPAAFAFSTEPRAPDRLVDLWQPQRSMTRMGP
jgi:hypothetical protein